MARVSGRDTAPERVVRSLIHRMGCRYGLHRKDLPGTPDIVLTALNYVVFVHGCFWHGHDCRRGRRPSSNVRFWNEKLEKNRQRDLRVLTIWECEIKELSALQERLAFALIEARKRANI
jgi:DNA mismatch endonuclease (patch repair protein)